MDKKTVIANNFYTNKYKDSEWLKQRGKDAQTLVNKIEKLAIFKPNSKVLDAACDSGGLASASFT